MVVVATPPLAVADHCDPAVELTATRGESAKGRVRRGNPRLTQRNLWSCNPHGSPITVFVLPWRSRTSWKKFLLLYFTLHHSHNVLAIVSLLSDCLIPLCSLKRFHVLFVARNHRLLYPPIVIYVYSSQLHVTTIRYNLNITDLNHCHNYYYYYDNTNDYFFNVIFKKRLLFLEILLHKLETLLSITFLHNEIYINLY